MGLISKKGWMVGTVLVAGALAATACLGGSSGNGSSAGGTDGGLGGSSGSAGSSVGGGGTAGSGTTCGSLSQPCCNGTTCNAGYVCRNGACESDLDGGTTGTRCSAAPSSCITPPPPPVGPAASGTTSTVLAVKVLYLGDKNASGQPDPNAWKSIGYDLDGLISKPTDTNHCMPVAGADPTHVKTDGNGGIDNSFGENVLPLIATLDPGFPGAVNQSIDAGKFTVIVKMDNLDSQNSETGVKAALYGGANMASLPMWDGTDQWPVTFESLTNGNIYAPKVEFPNSYVVNDIWVSGSKANVPLTLTGQSHELTLDITNAVITMKLAADRKSATAGVIAGVIDTGSLVTEFQKFSASIDPAACSSSTFQSIAQQLRAASDIMSDGTNGDPTRTCDAISIGVGFDASAVQIARVAPPAQPTDPCAP